MLLSDEKFTSFIKDRAVLVWEQVRPVPKVVIDFGDGKKLQRTLAGNTVLYFCTPDGTVVDAMPGVYTPTDFLERAKPALQLASNPAPNIRGYHTARFDAQVESERARTTLSKAFVESPLLSALSGMEPPVSTTLSKGAVESPILGRLPGDPNPPTLTQPPPRRPFTYKRAFEALASRLEDVSKRPASASELAKQSALPRDLKLAGKKIVERDSQTNVRYVLPAVSLLMVSEPQKADPRAWRNAIYERILHVPINDPYLGLADILVPGTQNPR